MGRTWAQVFISIPFVSKLGFLFIALTVIVALVGPSLAPYRVGEMVSTQSFAEPSRQFLLGTDALGRDVLSRLMHGARVTLGAAFVATFAGFLLGTIIGFAAAELRGRFDTLVIWSIDIFLSFPPVLFALVIIASIGSSLVNLIGVVAIIQASRIARVSRSVALNISSLEYVQVARARGERLPHVLRREIWPNAARPLLIEFGLRLTFSILFLSSLSFIGLGLQPPDADWGGMVRENLAGLYYVAPACIVPAALIGLLAIAINFIVDWFASQSGREISQELIS